MENPNKWCFAWFNGKKDESGANRAALTKDSKWASGDIITVSFLDGDPSVQKRVKEAALQWTAPNLANLRLVFQNNTNSLVRISFKYDGSWSTIGTTCKQVTDRTEPTMNYGWLDSSSSDQDVEEVVLHEFGHALGLLHEHQIPEGNINWDKEAVIRDLSGPPNNWSLETIEFNMFRAFEANETNFTKLDPESIMMYPFSASWTTDGFSTGFNTKLSATDKKFIHEQYK